MNIEQLVIAIDEEVARLTQAKSLLVGSVISTTTTRSAISPRLLANLQAPHQKPKRTMSEAGREAIRAAQKKRWRAIKKANRQSGTQSTSTGRNLTELVNLK